MGCDDGGGSLRDVERAAAAFIHGMWGLVSATRRRCGVGWHAVC